MPSLRRRGAIAAAGAGAAFLTPRAAVLAHSDGHNPGGDHHSHAHAQKFAAGEPGDPDAVSRVVEIVMRAGDGTMSFAPGRIAVRKGEQIKLVLRNAGELRHELVLDSAEGNLKHKAAMERNPDMKHEEPNGRALDPKTTAELVWRFTSAGFFEYACFIPGHYEAGMKGVLVVE
ncbi:MAG TPA: cupredoxin family protein [Hyphomicrobiaceae bacterium]|nr:cupredoxin family protein [Hyphomicrobiaceae bacterium]